MPETNWKKLHATDFAVTNSDWIPGLEATVRLQNADVALSIEGKLDVTPEHAACFRMLIDGWIKHLESITQQTEKHLVRFLPGRKLCSDELLLWGITLRVDDGIAEAASFFYRVGGDYNCDAYKLDQFDDRSVAELSCCIDNQVVGWDDLDIATTNDFD